MATPTKRRVSEPTHPSVWAGLVLATVGFLIAIYAYTGPRVYDIVYFFVAIVGALLALAGIFAAAWGRALGASRRKRVEKAAKFGAPANEPPTVAAPKEKRALLSRLLPKGAPKEAAPAKPVFAFKRRGASAGGDASGAAVATGGALERLTVACPRCETQFSAEGVRPFTAACPRCAFSAEL